MPTRDEYRKKAKYCIAQADRMHDRAERVFMLRLAHSFLKLAAVAGDRQEQLTLRRQQAYQHEPRSLVLTSQAPQHSTERSRPRGTTTAVQSAHLVKAKQRAVDNASGASF